MINKFALIVVLLAMPALHAFQDQSPAALAAAAAMEPATLEKDLETAKNFRAGVLRQVDEAAYKTFLRIDDDGLGADWFVSTVGTALAKQFGVPASDESARRSAASIVKDQIAGRVPLGGFLLKIFVRDRKTPLVKSGSDNELDELARNGMEKSEQLVRALLPADAAATFAADPPPIRALKTLRALEKSTSDAEWPSLMQVYFTDIGAPHGSVARLFVRRWGDREIDNLWGSTTNPRWRAAQFRKSIAGMFRDAQDVLLDKMTLSEFLPKIDTDEGEVRSNAVRYVTQGFGKQVAEDFKKLGAGPEKDKLLASSFLMWVGWFYSAWVLL